MFNALVDELPTSNHVLRLIPSNLRLGEEGDPYVFIYDLTAFTSNFHEHDAFIRALASFCSGYTVTIWDEREGGKHVDLGDLLFSYADHNLFSPSYSWERWNKSDFSEHYQDIAGFLGVYGNLMGCTFLHSVTVLTIIGDPSRLYTAGDDGGAVVFAKAVIRWRGKEPNVTNDFYDDIQLVFFVLSLLGTIAWSKTFMTSELGCIALKRPLEQIDRKLHAPFMLSWPSMILIEMYLNWPVRDVRYPDYHMLNTKGDCLESILTELLRFFKSIHSFEHKISDNDLESIWSYVKKLYYLLDLPEEGFVPQVCPVQGRSRGFVASIVTLDELLEDPVSRTVNKHWRGWARLPVRVDDGLYELADVEHVLFVGSEFVSTSSPLLSVLVKLRYLDRSNLLQTWYGEESYVRLLVEYVDPSPNVHQYVVNCLPMCFAN
jgi:hypothetical protein